MADGPQSKHTKYDPQRILAIVGPTCSGKTGLAMALAKVFPLEIVCMDAMQLYGEMEIGTARPSQSELDQAKHHLFGSITVNQPINSVGYVQLASKVLAEIQDRGKIPCMVGGTGLYMRSLFEGLDSLPPTPPELRRKLTQRAGKRGHQNIYQLLKRLDPRGAAHLHPNDQQRSMRFLEVRILTGKSILDHWQQQKLQPRNMPTTIGLEMDRTALWLRIQARTEQWLKNGWIEEVKRLKEDGHLRQVLKLRPIGYEEIEKHLNGIISFKELNELIYVATRQYAKRQMTWFRKASFIQWFPFDPNSGYNMQCVTDFIRKKWGNRPLQSID